MSSMSYTSANAQLQGRCKDRRKVANNTYLERRGEDRIALRLHNTDILIYHKDGRIEYQTGGWKTPTTKHRMQEFGPLRIWLDRGIWRFKGRALWSAETHDYLPGSDTAHGVYQDGMTWQYQDGAVIVVGAGSDPTAEKKARSRVTKYCRDFMNALVAGNVKAPASGDCCYCMLRISNGPNAGKPMGEAMPTLHEDGSMTIERADDHIESHIEDRYYVPSLLQRAMEVGGPSQTMWWWLASFWQPQEFSGSRQFDERPRVEKLLRKYVLGQMGMVR